MRDLIILWAWVVFAAIGLVETVVFVVRQLARAAGIG